MLSTNKPKISYVCGKKIYNIVSDRPEPSHQDCFHCLWLREVMWLCCTEWAISLHGKFILSHAPKLLSGGNFIPSPRGPSNCASKTKVSLQEESSKLHPGFFTQLAWDQTLASQRRHFFGDYLTLWKGFGTGYLGYPQPLEGCWYSLRYFSRPYSPGGDRSRPCSSAALKKHFHLSNKTCKVWVLLKHTFKFQSPSLISPITLSVLPQQEKKKTHKNKNPFEHFITGWGFSITKASHWFSIQLYFKKASII